MRVIGALPPYPEGEEVLVSGEPVVFARAAPAFRATHVVRKEPRKQATFRTFLMCAGLSGWKKIAKKVYGTFGEDTEDVIRDQPQRLVAEGGIRASDAQELHHAYLKIRALTDLYELLDPLGIDIEVIPTIAATFGPNPRQRIAANPYLLACIRDFSVSQVERFVHQIQPEAEPHQRAAASVFLALLRECEAGHCFVEEDELLARACSRLEHVTTTDCAAALETLMRDGQAVREMIEGRTCILRPIIQQAEVGVAKRLTAIAKADSPLTTPDAALVEETIAQQRDIDVDEELRREVRALLPSKVALLTGGPGVGKTQLTRLYVQCLANANIGLRVKLCAPTGKAARRLGDATRRESQTIHRLLGARGDGRFSRNESMPLDVDLLIVDEASMVSIELLWHLLRALPDSTRLLVVGDADQLPSVDPGKVLSDLIGSEVIYVARLTKVRRQARDSHIPKAALSINAGTLDCTRDFVPPSFRIYEPHSRSDALTKLIELALDHIPSTPPFRFTDVQVLVPRNAGELGVDAVNSRFQQELLKRGSVESADALTLKDGMTFRIGDRVIQTRNNYDHLVMNGDIGHVVSIDPTRKSISIDFDGERVRLSGAECADLRLAYAISVHKAQGSDFPIVIILAHEEHGKALGRSLLYTAITRAKRFVRIIGTGECLQDAASRNDSARRNTLLCSRLRDRAHAVGLKLQVTPLPSAQTDFGNALRS